MFCLRIYSEFARSGSLWFECYSSKFICLKAINIRPLMSDQDGEFTSSLLILINHIFFNDKGNEWDNVVCLPIIDISQNYKEELSSQELNFVTCKQLNAYVSNAEIGLQLVSIRLLCNK